MDLKSSKVLVPNSTFMEAHGDTRVLPEFVGTTFAFGPDGVKWVEARFAALEGEKAAKAAKKLAKGAKKEAEEEEVDPAPPTLTFADKAVEVFRFDPRIATQKRWTGPGLFIGDKEVKWINSGRTAGLAHREHCGIAWDLKEGFSLPDLFSAGGGLAQVSIEKGEMKFFSLPSLAMARTQKARGLSALQGASLAGMEVAGFMLAQDWAQLVSVWDFLKGMGTGSIFVRACPVRPRHGFVDSRVVTDLDQLKAVHDETLAEDPLGEWLLGPMIDAMTNIVATPQGISVGSGHDGATAGVGGVVTLPLASPIGMRLEDMGPEIAEKAQIAPPEVPYVEVVVDKENKPFLTQLRAGVSTPRSADYVPATFRVARVIRAEGSHIQWEKDMAALRGGRAIAEGVVVDHTGGGMVSHYTIHAVANGVPVLTSHVPVVGEVLEAKAESEEPYDLAALREGILSYYSRTGRKIKEILPAAIYAFHQAAFLRGGGSSILGWACACIHHAGVMAVAGESRHTHSSRKWDDPEVLALVPKGKARSQIFDGLMEEPYKTRRALTVACKAMRGTPWEGGYGGTLWNNCLNATIKLDDALDGVVKGEAGQDQIAALLGTTNQLLHLAHNNGWWMNKFISQEIMDLPYWRAKDGWLLPKLFQWVVPGMSAIGEGPSKAGLAKAKALWAEPRLTDEVRNLPCLWPHVVKQIQLFVPTKDQPGTLAGMLERFDGEAVPVFVWVQWNFGSGLAGRLDLTKGEIQALARKSVNHSTLALPVWMRGESGEEEGDEESGVKFTTLSFSDKLTYEMLGKDQWFVKTRTGVVLGEPLPWLGMDNDRHESLLAEALACQK